MATSALSRARTSSPLRVASWQARSAGRRMTLRLGCQLQPAATTEWLRIQHTRLLNFGALCSKQRANPAHSTTDLRGALFQTTRACSTHSELPFKRVRTRHSSPLSKPPLEELESALAPRWQILCRFMNTRVRPHGFLMRRQTGARERVRCAWRGGAVVGLVKGAWPGWLRTV